MTDTAGSSVNKLLLLKEYDGEGANGAKTFVAQCKKYFHVMPFTNDETRILVVLNRLTGKAADWATYYIVATVDNEMPPFANKEVFYNTFLARFAHVDDTTAAQIELDNLLKKGIDRRVFRCRILGSFYQHCQTDQLWSNRAPGQIPEWTPQPRLS